MSQGNTVEVQPTQTSAPSPQVRRARVEASLAMIQTNQSLAAYLGIKSPKLLTWLGKTKSTHYSKLYLRKKGKNSKLRVLHNPDKLMRIAQYRIYSKILNWIEVPEYIYAFEKDKSIPKMATKHVGKAVVISMDIKDFFHTIKQNRVHSLFQSLGIAEKPSRTLSELCTFKAFVPQGAITSPKLSNIIAARSFGPLIKAYCDGRNLTLTIYADDITISSLDPKLNYGEVISAVTKFVNESGFRVNTRKTKVMKKYNRQYVCGVVVNEKTNLLRKERLRLRAMVHNVKINGPEHEAQKNETTVDNFVNVLRGKINWFKQLNNNKAEKLSAEFIQALKLHKHNEVPVITTPASMDSIEQEMETDGDMLPWEEVTPMPVTPTQAPLSST